jgi:hypothetical protein
MVRVIRLATAAVWIVFGLVFKILGMVPRHQDIVAAVLGRQAAGPITLFIGGAETALGIWILTGIRPKTCMAVQTLAIGSMNVLEIAFARKHLLAPIPMVVANSVFLALGWYAALKVGERKRAG